jgi:translation initiation factor IF-2
LLIKRLPLPPNIRVYELARELGLTNKECLDLCESLGIGVKSHSSSVVEAQADRVRRKAEREGLVREQQPEEPKKAKKKAAAKPTKAKAKAAPKPETDAEAPDAPVAEPAPAEPAPAAAEVPAPTPVADAEVEPVPEPPAPVAPKPAPPRRVVTSSGSEHPPKPRREEEPEIRRPAAAATPPPAAPPAARPVAPAAQAPVPAPAPPRPAAAAARGPAPATPRERPPASETGKPIPPPPRPPVSSSGKPIPPPPGMRRPGGPGGGTTTGPGARRGPGAGGPPPGMRRSGGPGGPGGSPGGPSGGPGGGPGGPPGRGGPGGGPGRGPGGAQRRPPQRRKGRRRRSRDELQPMDTPTYTPNEAPVPEGVVVIERSSTPQELGAKLNRTAADVVRFLMQQGEMVTATQSLSDDMIELFAAEIGAELRLVDPGEEQEVELQKMLQLSSSDDDEDIDDDAPHRPPVITVMGHVDHGKTKLLDRIRDANVVAGEAGGITQHIGAYQADKDDRSLTFIDTPGHEAFTAMRARGAEATDIVVLVVAADDGVMPQTIEALNHAKAAGVPIVVAINKIDRENADPNRVMQQLSEQGLVPEAWGGDTVMVPVSALQGDGIDDLLENLLVVAELEDLRAEPDARARGVVLEANLDIGRGPVADLLVQRGTLKVGDPVVAGAAWGRVRALIDDHGNNVKEAGPSTPVQVLGLSEVAQAGDQFVVAPDEKTASRVAETREHWQRQASLGREAHAMSGGAKLEDIFKQIQAGEAATLNLILKADVVGSLEALTESLRKLERDDVKLSFVHRGVGGITQYDVQLAAASNATIIGFNVRPDRKAREMAETENVEIRNYEIIYQVLEDIENAMLGLLEPVYEEVVTGEAEVREIFRVPRIGAVAGCYVTNGVITRGSKVRFLRDGTIIWKGTVSSLKRFKDDAREVSAGYECGIGLSDFQDLKQGDIIETFEEREIPRT